MLCAQIRLDFSSARRLNRGDLRELRIADSTKVMTGTAAPGVACSESPRSPERAFMNLTRARRPPTANHPAMTTPPDDERTVRRGVDSPGAMPLRALDGGSADALPPGTRLHEFEILSVIGQGGFGIVYLAHDTTLDRHVAIKEYMPGALATRTQALTVAVRSSRHTETFTAGLRSFINEARLLAQFDHPSLLKVHRFWEAHGTAYMAMPYYAGVTMSQMLRQLRARPDEALLRALLHPLLDALALMHEAHCYHRDIAPDNILILPDGRPMLLDFGAARQVIGDMTRALTVILKTGYAPVEQYGEMPGMSQGAWTDIYALGSVMQYAITGHTPPQAVARFLADKREPLAVTAAGRYSERFLKAIDRALAVLPADRPQSAAEMQALLGPWQAGFAGPGIEPLPQAAETVPLTTRPSLVTPKTVEQAEEITRILPAEPPRRSRRKLAIAGAVAAALAAAAGASVWWGARSDTRQAVETSNVPATPAPAPAPVPVPVPVPTASETQSPAPAEAPSPRSMPNDAGKASVAAPIDPEAEPAPAPSPPAAVIPEPAPAPPPAAEPLPRQAKPAPSKAARAAVTPPQRIPNKKLSNERCADIIQRASLGEEPSAADKDFLKQECGQ